ncbi:uncharacterized protein PAC_04606 [Phialocephala subalpina]|uniref:Uncharacterized protein n=1 Tax=Phialocephala subalpina TaxID=576137 RepID=A0A1L7WPM7_9HELO|nr:uncharacterized protein PAC_04606 [Phialocephala subalpina]
MKAQNSPYNGGPQTLTVNQPKIMSMWWPMGILFAWIACLIAGAALIGSWVSNSNCVFDSDYDITTCDGKNGSYYAGLAFICIAIILKLVFWVLIIVRCYQRRKGYVAVTTVTHVGEAGIPLNAYQPYGGAQQVPGYANQAYADRPMPAEGHYAPQYAPQVATERNCLQCGTRNSGQWCVKCGAQVPM